MFLYLNKRTLDQEKISLPAGLGIVNSVDSELFWIRSLLFGRPNNKKGNTEAKLSAFASEPGFGYSEKRSSIVESPFVCGDKR